MATKSVSVSGEWVLESDPDGEATPVYHFCDIGEGETGVGHLETVYHHEDPPKIFRPTPEIPGHVYPTPK